MQSRIENILKAMIDNKPYSSKPLSRVEAILLAIKNNVPYHKLPKSRIEDMLLAIKNGSSYDSKPQGRIEEILFAKIHGLEYIKKPQSRIEELLFEQVARGYTVYFYNGETLLETVTGVPSGGTATYTGATPTSSQAGYIFSGWSPSNTNITADTSCYAQFVDEDMYESISDTWSEIIANVSNGTYSTKYQVGDTKKIDLGTEGEIIMQVVGIDADDLADNSGKAPMTWISKQLLKTSHRMNPARQSGTSGTGTLGGWAACEMRSYLINTIKPLLPSEVRNALKTVKKYSRIHNTSEKVVNNVVSNDDIWIPSAYEVNFTNYETSGVTYSTAFPDNASRIKHKVSGSAAWWWLRSAYSTYSFSRVSGGGSSTSYSADTSYGVALGFCT